MGGQSSSTQTQQSQTTPWQAAQPALQGILGQLNPLIQNSGLNSTESGAISQLSQNAAQGNPYASQIGSFVGNLFNGGGATAQAPNLQNGLSTLQGQLSPYSSGSMIGNNPALQAQLQQIATDTTNQVNSQFAAAGRDGSGANQQALARGIAQGEAPVIAGQYNQDIANQLSAANTLYGAQNSTSGLLSGMTQQSLANQLQGVTSSQDAINAQNYTPQQQLALAQLAQSIPAQNLGLLAQIGVPIAQLGNQSTNNSQSTQQMSGAQQFATIAGGYQQSPWLRERCGCQRREDRWQRSDGFIELVRSATQGGYRAGRYPVRRHARLRLSLHRRASLSHRPDGTGRGEDYSRRRDRDQRLQSGRLSRCDRGIPSDS